MFSMSYKLSKHLDRFEVYGTSHNIVLIKYIKQKEFVILKWKSTVLIYKELQNVQYYVANSLRKNLW